MHSWMRAALALAVILGMVATAQAATDLSSMAPPEVEALQKRLTDDGCYKGAIDGQASAATQDAIRACPDQDPVLRIETGMHVAPISRIGVDAACRLLATGSEDKTVRLWSLPEGRLIRTVRLPIGPGNGGKVFAVALSPDGKTLAAGGWDAAAHDHNQIGGHGLYLVDLASGGVRRVGVFENIINDIAFSADGMRIGVGLGGNGIRVLDLASGRELMADRDYGGRVYGLAFALDRSLVTTSYDGLLRRYGPDLTLAVSEKAPGGQQPHGIAISFDGRRIAVGYGDDTAVSILDAATLKPLAQAQTRDITNGVLASVVWAADGQLVAGGMAQEPFAGEPIQKVFLRRFSTTGQRLGADIAVAGNAVIDLKPCGTSIAFAAMDPRFGLLDTDERASSLQGPVTADLRDQFGEAFTASGDAETLRFGLQQFGKHPVLFNLAAGTLAEAPRPVAGLHAAETGGLPVTDWKNTKVPKFGGTPIKLEPYEISRSLAVRPDRGGFALGAEYWLRAFDAQGQERWHRPAPGVAWGVELSADGDIVVAAYGDGTIRWHRWSDGQELLALFVHAPTKRWVAWTPTGYYMASPGGEDLIGWQVNRGWKQEADFFPASRFRDKFNRPDVVRRVLTTLDEGEALKRADAEAHKRPDTKPLIQSLPPVITIRSPAAGASVPPGPMQVRYDVRLPSGGALARVEAIVDGAKVEPRGLARLDGDTAAVGTNGTIILPMPAHDASLSLVAYGTDGKASDAAVLALKSAAPAMEAGESKPSLYALLVGVSHYQDKSYDLGYAAADARGFAETLKAQEGRLYGHVEVKVLADGDATAVGLKRGLSWLKRQTTAHDLAIVFAAGHGTTDAKGRFWFLPADMDPGDIDATAVSHDEIADALYDLPGKKLLFLDACHAGAALNAGARGTTDLSAAINDFAQAEGGVVAYAASTGREFSLERPAWGHGAFTKALIEGFGGQADLVHDGTITTGTLDLFVERRVKELTGGAQHAVMTRPKTVPDFPIAIVAR